MTSTLLKGNSKKACPQCSEKSLFTNDSEKHDAVVHYHCLACNYQFAETAEEKDFYKKRAEESKGKNENSFGITLIVLIVSVIFAVYLSQREEQRDSSSSIDPVVPVAQLVNHHS